MLEGLSARAVEGLDGATSGLTAEEVAITAYLSRRLGEAIADPKSKSLKT